MERSYRARSKPVSAGHGNHGDHGDHRDHRDHEDHEGHGDHGDHRDEERALDDVLAPSGEQGRGSRTEAGRRIFAVIPEEVIEAPLEQFSSFLEGIFAEDRDLEEALDSFLASEHGESPGSPSRVRAVVPAQLLKSESWHPAEILDQVFDAFEEIDEALDVLRNRTLSWGRSARDSRPAVVPESLIAEPAELARAIEHAHTEAAKLEILFRQARHVLRRLETYRLSQRPPGQLVEEMRRANDLTSLQYLIEFLRSIHMAAESFEELDLPRVHIRDYLIHLYQMEDWGSMSQLVNLLRAAVMKYAEGARTEETSDDPRPGEGPSGSSSR